MKKVFLLIPLLSLFVFGCNDSQNDSTKQLALLASRQSSSSEESDKGDGSGAIKLRFIELKDCIIKDTNVGEDGGHLFCECHFLVSLTDSIVTESDQISLFCNLSIGFQCSEPDRILSGLYTKALSCYFIRILDLLLNHPQNLLYNQS